MRYVLHILLVITEILSVVTYQEPNRFRHAVLVSVHDGDTVKLNIEIGDGLGYQTSCRLKGINSRELSNRPGGQADRDYLKALLATLAPDNRLVAELGGEDKYGRRLVRLWCKDPITSRMVNLNQMMVDAGHAAVYMDDGK